MSLFSSRPPRPRLTLPMILYLFADVFGICCFANGASWLVNGSGALYLSFPSSTLQAVICTVAGLAITIWSAGHMMGEIAKQAPELQVRYREYMRTNHPEKELPPLERHD